MWRSPNGLVKNEIDYILTNKKSIVKNVKVIQRVNVGSDHRLVRGTIKTNTRIERCKMMRTRKSKVNIKVLLLKEEDFSCNVKTALKCYAKKVRKMWRRWIVRSQTTYRRVP